MKKRPKILLYWGYHRKAWTIPFEKIERYFEFIYVFHFDKSTEILERNDLNVTYFSTYKSIPEMLSCLMPDKVVFIGLDGVMPMLINDWANRMKIETFIIQHGFLYTLRDKLKEYYQEKDGASESEAYLVASDKKYSKAFLLRSLDIKNIGFFINATLSRMKFESKSEHEWLLKFQDNRRKANNYLLFAPYYAKFYKERDRVEDRISFVGNHEFENLFQSLKESTYQSQKYLLLIDQPLFHPYQKGRLSKYTLEEATRFYLKLSAFAEGSGLKLIIKLHPYSFNFYEDYPKHANITYVQESDNLNQLIGESKCVAGFYSTLIFPIIPFKPTVLFRITGALDFITDLAKYDLLTVLNLDCSVREITDAFGMKKSESNKQSFIDDFLDIQEKTSEYRLKTALSK